MNHVDWPEDYTMKNSEQNLGNHNVSGYRFIDPPLQLIHRVVSCPICFTEQILNLTTNQHKCISKSECQWNRRYNWISFLFSTPINHSFKEFGENLETHRYMHRHTLTHAQLHTDVPSYYLKKQKRLFIFNSNYITS